MNSDVILFSLIALEKFAQTSENKSTIKVSYIRISEGYFFKSFNYLNLISES